MLEDLFGEESDNDNEPEKLPDNTNFQEDRNKQEVKETEPDPGSHFPSLVRLCIDVLVQYKHCLGNLGYLEVPVLRSILSNCGPRELEYIENETRKESHYDLSWYTWHIWQRLYGNLVGLQACKNVEVPPLKDKKPVDYFPPTGTELREGDWRALFILKETEIERRRNAVKRVMAEAHRREEIERQTKKKQVVEMEVRVGGSVRRRGASTASSSSPHWSTVGANPKDASVMKNLGLIKQRPAFILTPTSQVAHKAKKALSPQGALSSTPTLPPTSSWGRPLTSSSSPSSSSLPRSSPSSSSSLSSATLSASSNTPYHHHHEHHASASPKGSSPSHIPPYTPPYSSALSASRNSPAPSACVTGLGSGSRANSPSAPLSGRPSSARPSSSSVHAPAPSSAPFAAVSPSNSIRSSPSLSPAPAAASAASAAGRPMTLVERLQLAKVKTAPQAGVAKSYAPSGMTSHNHNSHNHRSSINCDSSSPSMGSSGAYAVTYAAAGGGLVNLARRPNGGGGGGGGVLRGGLSPSTPPSNRNGLGALLKKPRLH